VFDIEWLTRFGPEVTFARAELDAEGLYYDVSIQPLGVAASRAAQGASSELSGSWHDYCLGLNKPKDLSLSTENRLLRPHPVPAYSYTDAGQRPELLANKVVFIGGMFGVEDRFQLRGEAAAQYGVVLHAWSAVSELSPIPQVSSSAALALDIVVGLTAGAVFATLLKLLACYRHRFAYKAALYVVFFAMAIALPAGLLLTAASLAHFGLAMSVAGMIISVLFDSFFSAHERMMSDEDYGQSGATATLKPLLASALWVALHLIIGVALILFLFQFGNNTTLCAMAGFLVWMLLKYGTPSDEKHPSVDRHAESAVDAAVRGLWLLVRISILALAWSRDGAAPALALALGKVCETPWQTCLPEREVEATI
jgi:hypothetical protein